MDAWIPDTDRIDVVLDEPGSAATVGLVTVATVALRLVGRVGGVREGRKVLPLVVGMVAGGSLAINEWRDGLLIRRLQVQVLPGVPMS